MAVGCFCRIAGRHSRGRGSGRVGLVNTAVGRGKNIPGCKAAVIRILKLKVDERLYVARFDLHHAPDHRGGHHYLQYQRGVGYQALCRAVDAARHEVEQVARTDQGEDARIARDDLRDHRDVEVEEYLVQHQFDGLHRLGAEHQPAQADEVEREDDAERTVPPVHLRPGSLGPRDDGHPQFMQRQRYAMQRAPEDEADRRTVPQPSQHHRDEQVAVGAQFAFAVAAQRDVEVVAQPRGERDMPPAPEFGDGGRLVRGVEVLGEAEAQQQGDADRHVRVAREVAVDLQGIAVDARQALEARIEQRLVEDAVDEIERDVVRNDRLFEESRKDQEDSRAEHFARHDDRVAADLGDEVPGPDDRACDQLGEEREVEKVVAPVAERFELSAVDVDRVAHRLEHEERDADRQEDVLELEEPLPEHLVGDVDQEVGVFEISQHPEVHHDAQYDEPPFRGAAPHAVDALRDQEVARGGEDEQQEIDAA